MPKGGARTRSGPPPDPNALRRDRPSDAEGWRTLPAEGRRGATPPWPLSEDSEREAELWRAMWRRPQAVAWEDNAQHYEVAMFVRSLAAAEDPKASVNARTLVRQQMDSLGITQPGLRSNRWRIGDAPPAKRATGTEGRSRPSAGARLRMVEGGNDDT
jgi:hypothetical protein